MFLNQEFHNSRLDKIRNSWLIRMFFVLQEIQINVTRNRFRSAVPLVYHADVRLTCLIVTHSSVDPYIAFIFSNIVICSNLTILFSDN